MPGLWYYGLVERGGSFLAVVVSFFKFLPTAQYIRGKGEKWREREEKEEEKKACVVVTGGTSCLFLYFSFCRAAG